MIHVKGKSRCSGGEGCFAAKSEGLGFSSQTDYTRDEGITCLVRKVEILEIGMMDLGEKSLRDEASRKEPGRTTISELGRRGEPVEVKEEE